MDCVTKCGNCQYCSVRDEEQWDFCKFHKCITAINDKACEEFKERED